MRKKARRQAAGYNPVLFNVSQHTRKPERKGWDIGYQHEYNKDSCKIYKKLAEYAFYFYLADAHAYKEGSAYRRSDGSYTEVKDHHNTKMYGIHSECSTDRQKYGGKYQAGRSHIHKGAYKEQKQVNN